MTVVLFIAGLVLLIIGAEALVRGASSIAAALGISPLVVGLTVVAYGTSAPEVAVSVMSGLAGQADVALGNVVGSNIFNVLFILGASATIAPLVVSAQLVRLDVPFMIAISFVALAVGFDGTISRIDGLVLVLGLIAYTVFLIRQGRRTGSAVQNGFSTGHPVEEKPRPRHPMIDAGLIIVGLGLLVLGSQWLVDGAVSIAHRFGIDELVIGLTIVAAGTSLPEVATSVIASIRGERDIAVGNVVGSNIFNILGVLGLSSIVIPEGIGVPSAALRFDIPVMIAVAVACLPIFLTGNLIARWEGGLFLGYYVAYTAYVILKAGEHAALPVFSAVMVLFVIPLTVLTLAIVMVRALRSRQ